MKKLTALSIVLVGLVVARPAATTKKSPVPLASSTCIDAGDPDTWLVRTGGFWKQGKRFGHFRVVVVRKGIEHATDWAQLQVIESDDQTQKKRVVSCVDLHTPGVKGYARDITFNKATDKLTAVGVSMEMRGMGEVVLQDVFLVSNDGKVSKLVEAKAVDLGD